MDRGNYFAERESLAETVRARLASEGIRHEAALAAFLHDAHGVRVVSAGAGAGPTGRRGFAFEPESRRFVVPAGAAPPTKRFQQIGRASCRARVCQSVSISGVAVYLK